MIGMFGDVRRRVNGKGLNYLPIKRDDQKQDLDLRFVGKFTFSHKTKNGDSLFGMSHRFLLVPPVGIEPTTHGLAYHYGFRHRSCTVCSLDYIFTITGAARVVSTEPQDNHLRSVFPTFDYS